jgi:hypothetical protein
MLIVGLDHSCDGELGVDGIKGCRPSWCTTIKSEAFEITGFELRLNQFFRMVAPRMHQSIRDVHDPSQAQAVRRHAARRVMKSNGFHDRIGETPQAQEIRTNLGVMRLHLRDDVLASARRAR